jgi:uncharacterized protein (DUF433 family)
MFKLQRMSELKITQTVPLTRGEDKVMRVTGSRVTLEALVRQFKNGATAEQMQEDFPSLTLSEIYSVIAYYLQHSHAVQDYLDEQDRAVQELRRETEAVLDTGELRQRLRQRRMQATA